MIVLTQNTDQPIGKSRHLGGMRAFVGARLCAGLADVDMREIDRVARTIFRLGNMQRKRRAVGVRRSGRLGLVGHSGALPLAGTPRNAGAIIAWKCIFISTPEGGQARRVRVTYTATGALIGGSGV
jgi:hypothetical protein